MRVTGFLCSSQRKIKRFLKVMVLLVTSLSVFNCKKSESQLDATLAPSPTALFPQVDSLQASESFYYAFCSWRIVSEGGSPVTETGICWDTLAMPTINSSHQAYGRGRVGTFQEVASPLIPLKKYFVRAYASNLQGTSYSNEVEFVVIDATPYFQGKNFKLYGKLDTVFKQCKADDILRFEDSGVLNVDGTWVRCDGNDPQVTFGTWSLVYGGTMLRMDWLGQDHIFNYSFAKNGDLILMLDASKNWNYLVYEFYFEAR